MTRQTVNHSRAFAYNQRKQRRLLGAFAYHIGRFLRKAFKKKKIVIISDKKIVSIPISTSMQAMFCLVLLAIVGWLSYSSGRYLTVQEALYRKEQAFQQSLSEKEQEITTTNLTNKDLLSQVTDLQRSLMRINNYFQNSVHGPQQPPIKGVKSDTSDKKVMAIPAGNNQVATAEDVEELRKSASTTLKNIDKQIKGQIKRLEKAVALTGLELEDVSDVTASTSDSDNTAQGGPYYPSDDGSFSSTKHSSFSLPKNLGKSIDYLLQLEEVVYNLPLTEPVASARITSGFGRRTDPIRGTPAMHSGLDFAGPAEAKIYATAPGTINLAQRTGAYGNLVEIDHGNGITTRYGHLSKVLVHPGMQVQRGQVIGIQGSTGRSTGAHVHYEVRYDGVPRNPQNFIQAGAYVFSKGKS